jgi:SAM-dependent methyltransferase
LLNSSKDRMFRFVASLLLRHRPSPAELLDVGCSYGGFLVRARTAGYRGIGCDIVPAAVAHVRQLGFASYQCSSVSDLPAAVRDVDVVTSLDCNYYWPDQKREIMLIRERLRTGGVLCMRVVDKSWLFRTGLIVRRVSRRYSDLIIQKSVNDHRFSMPARSLLNLLQETGFNIIYASPRGALHSDRSGLAVKMAFALGSAIHKLTGRFIAPGVVILASKAAE